MHASNQSFGAFFTRAIISLLPDLFYFKKIKIGNNTNYPSITAYF